MTFHFSQRTGQTRRLLPDGSLGEIMQRASVAPTLARAPSAGPGSCSPELGSSTDPHGWAASIRRVCGSLGPETPQGAQERR
jgi:hypothetical protein